MTTKNEHGYVLPLTTEMRDRWYVSHRNRVSQYWEYRHNGHGMRELLRSNIRQARFYRDYRFVSEILAEKKLIWKTKLKRIFKLP